MSEKTIPATVSASSSASNEKMLTVVATVPLVGLIMFYAMKDASPLVKNYAKQSNFIFALWIVATILGGTVFALPLGILVGLLELVAWVMLVIKAWEGKMYKLPVVGEFFDTLLK